MSLYSLSSEELNDIKSLLNNLTNDDIMKLNQKTQKNWFKIRKDLKTKVKMLLNLEMYKD